MGTGWGQPQPRVSAAGPTLLPYVPHAHLAALISGAAETLQTFSRAFGARKSLKEEACMQNSRAVNHNVGGAAEAEDVQEKFLSIKNFARLIFVRIEMKSQKRLRVFEIS